MKTKMPEDMNRTAAFIKLPNKPGVPQDDEDIEDLFTDSDNRGSETESCFSGFETDEKSLSQDGITKRKVYIKRALKKPVSTLVANESPVGNTVSEVIKPTQWNRCTCNDGDVEITCVSFVKKGSKEGKSPIVSSRLRGRTEYKDKGHKSELSFIEVDTRIISKCKANMCRNREIGPELYGIKIGNLPDNIAIVNKISGKEESKSSKKSIAQSRVSVRKNIIPSEIQIKSTDTDRNSEICRESVHEISFKKVVYTKMTETKPHTVRFARCDHNSASNYQKQNTNNNEIDKDIILSTHPNSSGTVKTLAKTPNESLLSLEMDPECVPFSSNVNEDVANEAIEKHEKCNMFYLTREHDYSAPVESNPVCKKINLIDLEPADSENTPGPSFIGTGTREARPFSDFPVTEEEAAQIMLDLFYNRSQRTEIEDPASTSKCLKTSIEPAVEESKLEVPETVTKTSFPDEALPVCNSVLNTKVQNDNNLNELDVKEDCSVNKSSSKDRENNEGVIVNTACKSVQSDTNFDKNVEADNSTTKLNCTGGELDCGIDLEYGCNIERKTLEANADASNGDKNVEADNSTTTVDCTGGELDRICNFEKKALEINGQNKMLTEKKQKPIPSTKNIKKYIKNRDVEALSPCNSTDTSISVPDEQFHSTKDGENLCDVSHGNQKKVDGFRRSPSKDSNLNVQEGEILETEIEDVISYPFEQNELFDTLGLMKTGNYKSPPKGITATHIAGRTRSITKHLRGMKECYVVLEDCLKILGNKNSLRMKICEDKFQETNEQREENMDQNLCSSVQGLDFEGFTAADVEIAEEFVAAYTGSSESIEISIPQGSLKKPEEKDVAMVHNSQTVKGLKNCVVQLQNLKMIQTVGNDYKAVSLIPTISPDISICSNSISSVNKSHKEKYKNCKKRKGKRIECETCGKSCYTKSELKWHIMKKHRRNEEEIVNNYSEVVSRTLGHKDMSENLVITSETTDQVEENTNFRDTPEEDSINQMMHKQVELSDCKTSSFIESQTPLQSCRFKDSKEKLSSGAKISYLNNDVISDSSDIILPKNPLKRKLDNSHKHCRAANQTENMLFDQLIKEEKIHFQCQETNGTKSNSDTKEMMVTMRNVLLKNNQINKDSSALNTIEKENLASDDVQAVTVKEECALVIKHQLREGNRRMKHKTVMIHGKRWYPCQVCNHKFSASGDLARHMRKHTGERPYQCPVCQSSFKQKGALNKHSEIHKGSKPYQCKICNSKFSQKVHLKTHLRVHTGERPFRCDLCGKSFSRLDHLKGHLNTHTEERPFKCKVCNRGFKCCSNLSKHKRIHEDEKFYKCQHCPSAFISSQSLRSHNRIHTGEKPFNCPLCNTDFRFESSLRKHAVTKHPDFEVRGVVLIPRVKK